MFIQLAKNMWVNPQFIAAIWKEPMSKRQTVQQFNIQLNGGRTYLTEGSYAKKLLKAKFPDLLAEWYPGSPGKALRIRSKVK